jgi:hypothetical protein
MKPKKTVSQESSMNDIVDFLGIKRIGTYTGFDSSPKWEYNGKIINRPSIKFAWLKVKTEFGIDSDLLKVEGYYKDEN